MSPEETILVPLAEGFEEIEAVALVDVLRRAELDVTVAGLRPGPVTGAHGIAVCTDCDLDAVAPERVGVLVLPGGMPGTRNLREDERVVALVRRLCAAGKPTVAICAAPTVLAVAGVLAGRRVTSHPSVRGELGDALVLDAPRVVRSGNVWTSQGPGTAVELGLALVEELCGPERARALSEALLVGAPGAVRTSPSGRR